ncbi:CBS domain-containing protein [Carex littledalei]|uniref:CBS domain-containing protein n=1 Tax=Carex littledalei TaxID=544730 RepID=A0A833QE76_9POAL|nr:CBS domain-containing protein [Carex littledalei]
MACINSFPGTSPNILRSPRRSNTISCRRNCRKLLKAPLASTFSCGPRLEMDENPEGIISGEWSENFSLLSYDDLRAYLESQRIKSSPKTQGIAGVSEVMSTPVRTAKSDQTLEEVAHHFEAVSTLPVVDGNLICIGVISKNDQDKASHGLQTRIGEMMSSPAITLSEDKTVMDAAALMLKSKVHRIPVVNKERRVIGIITRKDVLQELEALLK